MNISLISVPTAGAVAFDIIFAQTDLVDSRLSKRCLHEFSLTLVMSTGGFGTTGAAGMAKLPKFWLFLRVIPGRAGAGAAGKAWLFLRVNPGRAGASAVAAAGFFGLSPPCGVGKEAPQPMALSAADDDHVTKNAQRAAQNCAIIVFFL